MFTVVACPSGANDGSDVLNEALDGGMLAAHTPRTNTVTIAKARAVEERLLTMKFHGSSKV